MELITASALINFYGKLEDQVAKFYEDLATNGRCAEGRETFLVLARENKKHKEIVLRAYRQVITDAIEACHFGALNEGDYAVKMALTADMRYTDALKMAMEVEEKSNKFCIDAYEVSKAFLADVSQALERVAKEKAKRKLTLRSLLDKATAKP